MRSPAWHLSSHADFNSDMRRGRVLLQHAYWDIPGIQNCPCHFLCTFLSIYLQLTDRTQSIEKYRPQSCAFPTSGRRPHTPISTMAFAMQTPMSSALSFKSSTADARPFLAPRMAAVTRGLRKPVVTQARGPSLKSKNNIAKVTTLKDPLYVCMVISIHVPMLGIASTLGQLSSRSAASVLYVGCLVERVKLCRCRCDDCITIGSKCCTRVLREAEHPLLKWLWDTASFHDRGTEMLLRWVNQFSVLQSDFDKNSKEVTPFSSAFTRQREIWAGRTASASLTVASQVTLHLMAHPVYEVQSSCITALSGLVLGVDR